jgi:hypothetical protein
VVVVEKVMDGLDGHAGIQRNVAVVARNECSE